MENSAHSLMHYFGGIQDPRVDRTKRHKLIDILVLSLCGVIAGADSCDAIEIFAASREEWFRRFLELPNGIPSHDTFERVLARINPVEFRRAFSLWTKTLTNVFAGENIAIDGQTARGARQSGQDKSPIHMVSAWANEANLVLGQIKVDEKSNEITAIPELLRLLEIKGCLVTIDAMGCQQTIAKQIIDQGGDYALALKKNQENSLTAVEEHFSLTPETACPQFQVVDKGHGRIETRTYYGADAAEIHDLKPWPGLKSAIKVVSTREIGPSISIETRYYLSSIESSDIERSGKAIRSHWGVENKLHYVLDVTFHQDGSRLRKGYVAENFIVLRHMALNLLKASPPARKGSASLKLRRIRAGCDVEYFEAIVKAGSLEKSDI